ncbi:hypothetical protein [Brevundimonas sp. TSRC1-1]|uniref:hypothetical protein n=1 Tax=Brevundimonas sp. TSRC1-1 TaxID=2804562 RepID=UPI003CF09056
MADVTNDLIYEVLKSMQTRLDRIDGNVAGVRGELQAMRLHLNGLTRTSPTCIRLSIVRTPASAGSRPASDFLNPRTDISRKRC